MDELSRFIRNPLVTIGGAKEILALNPLAVRLLGEPKTVEEVFASEAALEALLSRAAGSSEPALGALEVNTREGVRRFRVNALALRGDGANAYALEIRQADENAFAMLTERVRELNAELGARRRAQAQLEEALAQNRLLYMELQHRVKNHLQMILALVSAAGRESEDPRQRDSIRGIHGKLSALFDAQRLMYAEAGTDGVRADQMIHSIAETVQSLAGGVAFEVSAEPLLVSNDVAFPVALIANELLTNAAKYGTTRGAGRIVIRLERRGPEVRLEVRDSGPGFTPRETARSTSGLGLVRGLCRQIGGRLEIAQDAGAVITVSFPASEALHVLI